MSEEKAIFDWKHSSSTLTSRIADVFAEKSLSDVTLVSDDRIPFKAHKCVLSAFSPVLKSILLTNHHSHPLIFLAGVKHQELFAILQFIYLGKVSVNHRDIDRFLWAAKDLKIKQVMIGNSKISRDDYANKESSPGQNSIITEICV